MPTRRRRHLPILLVAPVLAPALIACQPNAQRAAPAHPRLPSVALAPDAPASAPLRVESNDGTYLVEFATRPPVIPVSEPFALEVTVFDRRREGTPLADVRLDVDAAMPEHRHGMNVVPQVWSNNGGTFTVTGMEFHMPGRWELYFDVTRNGQTERAQTEIWLE